MTQPACLSDALPHNPALGLPGPASDEEVVVGLPLSAAAPPALVRRDPSNLVGQVGPGRSASGEEMVVSSDKLLSLPPDGEVDGDTPRESIPLATFDVVHNLGPGPCLGLLLGQTKLASHRYCRSTASPTPTPTTLA